MQLELLDHEERIIEQLRQNYKTALADIRARVRKMKENPSFKEENIYQVKYQMMLEAQLETILYKLGEKNVKDMSGYLDQVYREAYLGCLYGMHGDGVDLILQIDENKVQMCINKDTKDLKFSQRLYDNVEQLKDTVKKEIARGFSTGRDYASIARQISMRAGVSLGRACVIARTEGHRVTSESEMDCMTTVKSKGADVLKEWISTLDSVTRETHVELDGQIRELEEEFVIPSSGAKAMYPGGFGIAKEDIQCRCCMNQRARWNLGSEEYRYSRAAGEVVSIRSDIYSQWKRLYNKAVEIMFENAEGRSYLDNAGNFSMVIQAISSLPPSAQTAMLDVKYEFGGNHCYCEIENRVIRYADNVTAEEIYHEMGHLLEGDLFPKDEVAALKKKYFQDASMEDICTKKLIYSDGETGKDIILLKNKHLLEAYQGRIYVEQWQDAFDENWDLKTEKLLEFMSVPISWYFTQPGKLLKRDPEMYEFIKRYLR